MKILQLLYILVVLVASAIASGAQTRVYPVLTDFNQALGAEVSYSFPADISRGAIRIGAVNAFHARASWGGTIRASESYAWLTGVEWRGSLFDSPAGAPIPKEVHSLALKLGSEWQFADRWIARFEAEPGLYSDLQDLSTDDFNALIGLRLAYSPSTNLTWVLGLNVDVRSDLPLVGGPGVRWKFAPDWTLNFIMPRPRIEFALNDSLALFAGGELKSGSWRLAENFGTQVKEAGLNNELVDYREIRIGGGFRWKLGRGWAAMFDGGWVLDRRFTFEGANLLLNGGGAPYFQAGVAARF